MVLRPLSRCTKGQAAMKEIFHSRLWADAHGCKYEQSFT